MNQPAARGIVIPIDYYMGCKRVYRVNWPLVMFWVTVIGLNAMTIGILWAISLIRSAN